MRSPLAYDLYIFDMGNVVIQDIEVIDKIAFHYGFDLGQLQLDYSHYAFPLMDGTIDSKHYWSHVAHQFGIQVEGDPLADFFQPRWNTPVLRIVEKLRSLGKRVVCGSNTYAPHWQWLRERDYLSVFDEVYASHEMGISKPASQFYGLILKQESVEPYQVLFVDDYLENLDSAQKLGIDTIQYQFDEGLSNYFGPLFI